MSYALYDDNLPSNRKVAWLKAQGTKGIAALGLHVLANTWCRHEGMLGFVPSYVPEQLVGREWRKLVALLSDEDGCGMFVAVEGGWMINGYDEYGRDDGRSADDRKAELSRKRAEAGRRGGLAKAKQHPGKRDSKTEDLPEAKRKQSSSPTPIPTNSPTSTGSRNVPAGALPQVITAYVRSGRDAGVPTPEASQDRVQRSAARLLAEGYPLTTVIDAARNAAIGGWTDLATQLQRDASRASPTTNGTTSTADQRFQAGLDLANQLDRKALP